MGSSCKKGWIVAAAMTSLGTFVLGSEERAAPPLALAVIVHAENKVLDPTQKQLRSLLLLERQFWPEGGRILLFRRPTTSTEEKLLLEKVYEMSAEKLRRYWVRRLFAGEIPAIPSIIRGSKAAAEAVRKDKQALSIVLSTEVPEGVRVLAIDGKRPGEKDYLLALEDGH